MQTTNTNNYYQQVIQKNEYKQTNTKIECKKKKRIQKTNTNNENQETNSKK